MAAPGAATSPPRALPPLLLALLLLALAPCSSAAGRRACTYTLRVKTSCASPARTSDAVSVAFGDAYRNEVHAPRLPTAAGTGPGGSRALERCGTDTFRVAGPCGYGVCYLYLRRSGRDGWAPEWVQVVQPGPRSGDAPATATFYFGDPLPEGVWYGHDRCPKSKASADDDHPATTTGAPRASNSSAPPQE
ncbi:hypothetical protein SEVIR_3G102500v4 [Setaria viridis]|uniref:Uncharacterized protein n=1 Tax=Setaria viridis TaxID=4556 RepID=A0A4U6V7M2_SETVI|nr:embryo-specific protein ATS3A-like [Setaria viridis]TKW25230.1 hypothetical protein SEVIR_3G102500v2 [Setaria viridis]